MTQPNEKSKELTKMLTAERKRLFAGAIEQMFEAEIGEHLGYSKHSVDVTTQFNIRNGYNEKTIKSEWAKVKSAYHAAAPANLSRK